MEQPRALFDRVLAAYAAEGFPAEIIGQWALPADDANDLINWVQEHRPKSVLEVGTYVGVSTMLIALACGKTTRIISIDPNFPLSVEMSSAGSLLGSIDASARTHDVAAAVARRLGVSDQIELLSGGFTSGASFASRRTSPDLVIPVVGPDVCKRYGPFDLAFIDGLHYADVVESDVALASRYVAPDGVILMHDCVGMWGTNVRSGLSRFLTEFPDWSFLHPPLSGLYRSIGVLFQKQTHPELELQLLRKPRIPAAVESQLLALTTSITQRLKPDHVIELATGEPVFATKFDQAVAAEVVSLGQNEPDAIAARLAELAKSGEHAVLVVSAGGLDLLDAGQLGRLFRAIAQHHAIGIFLRTPAGEAGSVCINGRPLRSWVRIAGEAGAAVAELSPLDLAPLTFLFTTRTDLTPDSSALCNLVAIISSKPETPLEMAASRQLVIIDERGADRLEQHDLLNVHYAGGFRWAFRQISETQRLLRESNQQNVELEAQLSLARHDVEDLQWQKFQSSKDGQMVEAALAHAVRHGYDAPCLMLSVNPQGAVVGKLLADPRVGSICVRDGLPEQYAADGRVGRFSDHENWSLPSAHETVYFIGHRPLLTASMWRQAIRTDVQYLSVPVGFIWVRISMQFVRRCANQVRMAYRLRAHVREALARAGRSLKLPKPFANRFMTLDEACGTLVIGAQPRGGYVAGRVVHVCGNLSPGGAERQVANTLVGLSEAGIADVSLLAHFLKEGSAHHNFHLPRVIAAGVAAREIERVTTGVNDPTIPKVLRRAARGLPADLAVDIANLVREFERLRPEVVHAWLDWDNVRAGLAAAMAGVPKILLSGRNLNPSHFLLHESYMGPAYRALVALPNVTILNNSRAGADDYADWIGIPRHQIKVIHNGVSFADEGRPAPDAVLTARRKLGISDGNFVVGGVFRFEEEKQPLLWLDVAAHIRRAVPEARFLLYGQGSLRAAMEAKVRDLKLGDDVIFAGVTDEPLAAMSMMNVLLLTSAGEGLPNVLLEAQWIGTPVVCTRAGGAPEAVDPGVSGWVVEVTAPQALANAVVHIWRNPDVAVRAAARGPIFVRERFGVSQMIAETLQAYGMKPSRDGAPRSGVKSVRKLSEMQAGA